MRDLYDQQAQVFADRYEQVSTEAVHGHWLGLLPSTRLLVLDVGASSGRDAAWFARQGHEDVAVEPSSGLRREGRRLHPEPGIQWVDDALPALAEVYALDYRFDVILLSGVWMHVPSAERLGQAAERIQDWWAAAYGSGGYKVRFTEEAEATLPIVKRFSSIEQAADQVVGARQVLEHPPHFLP